MAIGPIKGEDSIMAHGITLTRDTYWEKTAATKWGSYVTDLERFAILKAHELSEKPEIAFEIGVEGGRWSKLLADLGWKLICTDVDEETLAICQKRISTAHCVLVEPDDNRLPSHSESISLLLCMEVAPVIQSDWFIGEASRVLQNDELMVGVFWNLLSLRGSFAHLRSSYTGEYDYYTYSYRMWRRKLLYRGYNLLHEEGFCWFPFRRQSNSKLIPYFVRAEQRLGLRKLPLISPWVVFIAQKSPANTCSKSNDNANRGTCPLASAKDPARSAELLRLRCASNA